MHAWILELLPSPVIRTRDVVAIQSRQRVRCRCRSRWHYAICAIFWTTYLVFFTIVTSSFWPSLWSKILNVASLKKVLLNDLDRNKLLATTVLLSVSKRSQVPNPFLPLWNQLIFKSALSPAARESILAPLALVYHNLDHYTTVPIAGQPRFFHST